MFAETGTVSTFHVIVNLTGTTKAAGPWSTRSGWKLHRGRRGHCREEPRVATRVPAPDDGAARVNEKIDDD